MSRTSLIFLLLGALLLIIAAVGPTLSLPRKPDVLVMVDLSPSTRVATYRDTDSLQRRIQQLLGQTNYRIITFAGNAERTVFTPPPADAILLFSDARFDLPTSAPPIFIVVDPDLENPPDAAVSRLEFRGDSVTAAIRNTGQPRLLAFIREIPIPPGTHLITQPLDPALTTVSARFLNSDPWPENDAMSICPPLPWLQRWTITSAAQASQLSTDPAAYLSVSAIILNNIPADAIPPPQQERLVQFVRDLGGGLVILGGDSAFAAGNYAGTALEDLSPLSSHPPLPRRHWIILLDASGSMASRWTHAAQAIAALLPHLPPSDIVSLGSFARDLHWWSQSQSPADAAKTPLPHISPSGPTNLQPALQAIASQLDGSLITEIILISDADTTIDDPPALSSALSSKNARLHLLATADISHSQVPRLVELTGGRLALQLQPAAWIASIRQLLRQTMPDHLQKTPVTVQIANLPPRKVALWNRTWLKSDARDLSAQWSAGLTAPLLARWHFGIGQVIAAAFPATAAEADALADLVARPPRDPRFKIAFRAGPQLVVTIDAFDGNRAMDGLDLTLECGDITKFQQTAPGRYEISLTPPRWPTLAIIRLGNFVIDHLAVPGRYPPEFDSIGNDRQAMQTLASLSGGQVIEPSLKSPIALPRPRRQILLTSPLSIAGAACVALALTFWKLRL